MLRAGKDPIASWFVAAEELGEFVGIRFGRISSDGSGPEWVFLPHTQVDGVGGFAEILRRREADPGILPQIKHPLSPSFLCVLKALPLYFKPRQRVHWKVPGRAQSLPGTWTSKSRPPSGVAWHVFNQQTTTHIRHLCRREKVTVNSFLLRHLTEAIRPFLKNPASAVPWMVPVNIRGKVRRERDTDVHTSYVGIKVTPGDTLQDVHQHVYAALDRGEHWANWQMYLLGKYISRRMQQRLITAELGTSQWNLGAFSNLGDWDPEQRIQKPDCEGAWLFCPPVFRFQLVGAGSITFHNRLSLTMQAHPELSEDPVLVQRWVQNWVKEIEGDLMSASNQWPVDAGGVFA